MDLRPMELKDTVDGMLSPDYKERFRAEYFQTVIRAQKLKNMLSQNENGTLPFTPTCPITLLENQRMEMEKYITILEWRAKIEGIDLSDATGGNKDD